VCVCGGGGVTGRAREAVTKYAEERELTDGWMITMCVVSDNWERISIKFVQGCIHSHRDLLWSDRTKQQLMVSYSPVTGNAQKSSNQTPHVFLHDFFLL
jgi:hypothetical protein